MSEVVVPDPVETPPTQSELVVAELCEPGVDLASGRSRVLASSASQRRRALATVGAATAAAVLLGAVVWAVGRRGDDVATTADASSTTVAPVTSSTVPEAVPVAPVTTSSTVPAAAGVAPPAEPASESPLGAELSVSRTITVGTPFTLAIDWNDADHAVSGEPSVEVEWNDPYLSPAAVEPPAGSCGATGSPRAGRIERTFRYSTPGSRTISVRLRSCGGTGPLGEDVTEGLPVQVAGVAGAPLVAGVDAGAGDPDAAAAVRYDAATGGAQTLANRSEAVDQVLRRDRAVRATVLIAPGWSAGDVVLLQFPDEACRWAALGASGAGAAAVLTQQGCQPERPTTTTVPPSTSSSTTSTTEPPPSTTSP